MVDTNDPDDTNNTKSDYNNELIVPRMKKLKQWKKIIGLYGYNIAHKYKVLDNGYKLTLIFSNDYNTKNGKILFLIPFKMHFEKNSNGKHSIDWSDDTFGDKYIDAFKFFVPKADKKLIDIVLEEKKKDLEEKQYVTIHIRMHHTYVDVLTNALALIAILLLICFFFLGIQCLPKLNLN